MTTILALYLTAQARLQDALTNEEGQTSMEWLGIGAVVVAIAAALASQADPFRAVITSVFETLTNRITGG